MQLDVTATKLDQRELFDGEGRLAGPEASAQGPIRIDLVLALSEIEGQGLEWVSSSPKRLECGEGVVN